MVGIADSHRTGVIAETQIGTLLSLMLCKRGRRADPQKGLTTADPVVRICLSFGHNPHERMHACSAPWQSPYQRPGICGLNQEQKKAENSSINDTPVRVQT